MGVSDLSEIAGFAIGAGEELQIDSVGDGVCETGRDFCVQLGARQVELQLPAREVEVEGDEDDGPDEKNQTNHTIAPKQFANDEHDADRGLAGGEGALVGDDFEARSEAVDALDQRAGEVVREETV